MKLNKDQKEGYATMADNLNVVAVTHSPFNWVILIKVGG